MNPVKLLIFMVILSACKQVTAQNTLPFRELKEYPKEYSAGTVAARLIDGLGFRYYHATDSLREEDLAYKPNEDARSVKETLGHIYVMSFMIVNATTSKVNEPLEVENVVFEQMRKETLNNLWQAREQLMKSDDLDNMKIVFMGEDGAYDYPFWHHLNGPIADCLWHVGQVVSFRRSAGNPLTSKVSFFNGKIR